MSQCWTKPYYHIPSLGYNVYILIIYYIVLYPICVYPIQLYPYYITIYIIVVCVCVQFYPHCLPIATPHDLSMMTTCDGCKPFQRCGLHRPDHRRLRAWWCVAGAYRASIQRHGHDHGSVYIYIYHILIIVMYNSDHILYIYMNKTK